MSWLMANLRAGKVYDNSLSKINESPLPVPDQKQAKRRGGVGVGWGRVLRGRIRKYKSVFKSVARVDGGCVG